jgi:ATP-dependent Lhr-like helicase
VGSLLIFAGLRWQVVDVDSSARVIELTRSGGGRPPAFYGGGAEVADQVRKRMRVFYESDTVPIYLDATAQALLDEGRRNFARLRLAERLLVPWGDDTVILPWRGDIVLNTVLVALNNLGLRVAKDGVGLTVAGAQPATVVAAARELVDRGEMDAAKLADDVSNKRCDKYDQYLSDHLLTLAYASRSLDVPGAWEVFASLAAETIESQDVPEISVLTTDKRARARLGETPFAVVDIETTGFAPLLNDRIVEISIVQTDLNGIPTSQWSTLVNPLRTAGPTHIHGITDGDLTDAPTWGQVVDWVTDQLAGRIVVAHNAGFDLSFINIEFERADLDPPEWPVLDTLELAAIASDSPDRSLHSCCKAAGIRLENAHTAAGDAAATAQLLACYLRTVKDNAANLDHLLEDVPVTPTPYPRPSAPAVSPRRLIRPIASETTALIGALSAAYPRTTEPAENAYLAVLDRAVLSPNPDADLGDLLAEATRFGLDHVQAVTLTHAYLVAVERHVGGKAAETAAALLTRLA